MSHFDHARGKSVVSLISVLSLPAARGLQRIPEALGTDASASFRLPEQMLLTRFDPPNAGTPGPDRRRVLVCVHACASFRSSSRPDTTVTSDTVTFPTTSHHGGWVHDMPWVQRFPCSARAGRGMTVFSRASPPSGSAREEAIPDERAVADVSDPGWRRVVVPISQCGPTGGCQAIAPHNSVTS